MHPIRGYLTDPRISGASKAFHFGVDICGADGTAVHSVCAGTTHLEGAQNIAFVATDGSRCFGYWHIVPVVKHLQVVQRGQLVGHIAAGWGHVHFAEHAGGPGAGEYLNPLRQGALSPFRDAGSPRIVRIVCERGAVELDPGTSMARSTSSSRRTTHRHLPWRAPGRTCPWLPRSSGGGSPAAGSSPGHGIPRSTSARRRSPRASFERAPHPDRERRLNGVESARRAAMATTARQPAVPLVLSRRGGRGRASAARCRPG